MLNDMNMTFNCGVELDSLCKFLEEVDSDFPVSLSSKGDLRAYAEKLLSKADFVAYIDSSGHVKGLAAGYIRNSVGLLAYLSFLAVSRELRGAHAGGKLTARFVDEAEKAGLLGVHLYTDNVNPAAQKTYDNLGFIKENFSVEPRPDDVHYLKLLNKTVLLTAIGSFSASCAIEKLHASGFKVVGCDIYPRELVANSLKVDSFYQVPLASTGSEYIEALRKIILKERVGYVVPLTDYEVDTLCSNRDAIDALICMSENDSLNLCRNKLSCYRHLKDDFGPNLIPTLRLSDANIAELDYPVICKPLNGRSSEGLFESDSMMHLENAMEEIDADTYCVQPKIEGRIVTVDVVRDSSSGFAVAIPREELLRTHNGAGTSVRVFSSAELSALAKEITAALGVNGCVNLEFIVEPGGNIRFLECNPRFSGGVEFSCMAGYDCIVNHIRCFLGLSPNPPIQYDELFIARSYEAHVTNCIKH